MAISSPGVGSNLDVNGIISQLMAVEQRPLFALGTKEAGFQAEISAFGSLKSVLSSLNSAASALIPSSTQTASEKFTSYTATVADTTIASVTTTAAAVAGSYALEVTQLATAHRLESGVAPTITNGTLTIAIGTYTPAGAPTTFTQKTGTNAIDITIDSTNNTIEGVRDAINAAKAGVNATVVNGDAGKQLIIESNSTGTDSAIRIAGTTGFVYDPTEATPDTMTVNVAALDATLKINGIDITSQSNTVSSAINGITLKLLKGPVAPETSVSTTLTIARSNSSVTTLLNAFIKAYNDANTTIKNLGKYDAATKSAGPLNGDSTLRATETRMRNTINTKIDGLTGNYQRLSDIGVTMDKDGVLSLDTGKLDAAITADFADVATVVAGYGTSFKTATDTLIGASGILDARNDGLNASIATIGQQRTVLQARLQQIEARYRKQFGALDALISSFTQTSAYLQQQLANLPKIS